MLTLLSSQGTAGVQILVAAADRGAAAAEGVLPAHSGQ